MAKKEVPVGEAVGIVAAQSIGEPGTQMSLAYDEKVLVGEEDGSIRVEKIGELVDSMFGRFGFVSGKGHEICDLPIELHAPSLTDGEKIEWRKVTALSRHKSPEKMLLIRTRSGRSVTATPFHSFVIRQDNRIVPVAGSSLKKGDRLPALRNLPLAAARAREKIDVKPMLAAHLKYLVSANGMLRAYPREASKPFPQHLELGEEFGWLAGIYLAEGNSTRNYLSISSTGAPILEKVRSFAGAYGFSFNEYDNMRGFSLGHDIRINSTLLAQFLKATCGTGSAEKRIPDFAYSADERFTGALLRGYFDGDGNVNVERKVIRASSNSKMLIDGIALLLARLGIFAGKRKEKRGHTLSISHRYAALFLEKIGSDIGEKRGALSSLAGLKSKTDYNLVDEIPGIGSSLLEAARKLGVPSRLVNNFTKRGGIGRSTLLKYLALFETLAEAKKVSVPELALLRRAAEGDVVWDEIVGIDYVQAGTRYVYDFTVPGSETFTTFDGIITHNTMRTFHYAGVAEQVPTGLPRLIELVDARREPKKPMMDIYLRAEYARSEEKARSVAEKIERIQLEKVATIDENFADKRIEISLDEEELGHEGLTAEEVKKKVKANAGGSCESEGNRITVKPKVSSLRAIRRLTNKLREFHLKGVERISRAMVLKERGKDSYFIRTGGSNLKELLKHEAVDPVRTSTNDVKEVERVLGIEAARNALVREIRQVLDMQGLAVDVRHIMLLADAMTMDGELKSIGRHGLSGQKAGVLARAAFEETIKHLINASVKSEEDRLIGVTENIIIGQTVPVGTGNVRLVMKLGKD